MRKNLALLYFTILITASVGLSLFSAPESGSLPVVQPALAAEPAAIPILEGTWEGSWTDTLYNVTGSLTIDITVTGNSYSATGSIDITEIDSNLGTLTGTGTGTYDGAVLTGTFDCANLGSGTATIGGAFRVGDKVQAGGSGSGTVGSPLFFGPFVFNGTVAQGVIWGTFDFTNPGGGEGKAVLINNSLPTATETLDGVKALYRDG